MKERRSKIPWLLVWQYGVFSSHSSVSQDCCSPILPVRSVHVSSKGLARTNINILIFSLCNSIFGSRSAWVFISRYSQKRDEVLEDCEPFDFWCSFVLHLQRAVWSNCLPQALYLEIWGMVLRWLPICLPWAADRLPYGNCSLKIDSSLHPSIDPTPSATDDCRLLTCPMRCPAVCPRVMPGLHSKLKW